MSRLRVLIAAFALGSLCTLAGYELMGEGGKTSILGEQIADPLPAQQIAPELSTAETIPSFEEAASYWLRQYLITVIPGLVGASDWEKTSLLREWAYREIDRAGVESTLDPMRIRIPSQHPARILPLLIEDRGGFFCGGTSEQLARIYRLFGYTAYAWNMGTEDPITHSTTLVRLPDERGALAIQDAYFNFSVLVDGRPLDFSVLLERLEAKNLDGIDVQTGVSERKEFIFREDRRDVVEAYLRREYRGEEVVSTPTHAVFEHRFNLETYPERFMFEDWIEDRVGERNLLYLFLWPTTVSGDDRVHELAARAREIRQTVYGIR